MKVEMVASIYGSAKRGFFIHIHRSDEGPGNQKAGPYETKSLAKKEYKINYSKYPAWNF